MRMVISVYASNVSIAHRTIPICTVKILKMCGQKWFDFGQKFSVYFEHWTQVWSIAKKWDKKKVKTEKNEKTS